MAARVPLIALIVLLALPAWAADKITTVTIDGKTYSQIQDAHIVNGGRVVILLPDGGITVTPDKLPADFMDSWGITTNALAASRSRAEHAATDALTGAIAGGYFRELNGVVYDLRKPQTLWVHFTGARILQVLDDGAIINLTPTRDDASVVFVRNLPSIYTDNDAVDVMAGLSGTFSYVNGYGYQRTIRAYDVGRALKREEIPAAMLKQGLAAVSVPFSGPRHEHTSAEILPGAEQAKAVGSGFFVSKDGYVLTNFHVVDDADRVEVRHKGRTYKAEIVRTDEDADLAVVKVDGADFPCLPLAASHDADLGASVFTIGFPNIEMQGIEPKYTDGRISSDSGIQDDPTQYQITVPVQPGNSGGPLCDETGQVVGVIVARLNDMAMLRAEGALPQNVNYAIKASQAVNFLKKVPALQGRLAKRGPKPDNVVKSVEDAVVMLIIY